VPVVLPARRRVGVDDVTVQPDSAAVPAAARPAGPAPTTSTSTRARAQPRCGTSCTSTSWPGAAGVRQARWLGRPSTVTRQSKHWPIPQSSPRVAGRRRGWCAGCGSRRRAARRRSSRRGGRAPPRRRSVKVKAGPRSGPSGGGRAGRRWHGGPHGGEEPGPVDGEGRCRHRRGGAGDERGDERAGGRGEPDARPLVPGRVQQAGHTGVLADDRQVVRRVGPEAEVGADDLRPGEDGKSATARWAIAASSVRFIRRS
jgi:hypothetical protein